ncbi:MAG: nickel pincer cofactor biosynthesis protein LarB [bacterium]
MDRALRNLLEGVKDGRLSIDESVRRLRDLAFEDLGFANVDHHRQLRRGFPEVVFAPGKTVAQIVEIAGRLIAGEGPVLVTRVEPGVASALLAAHAGGEHNAIARTVRWRPPAEPRVPGILVVSAGTSDMPVAEEAAVTAETFGHQVERLYDVGVAGLHRLLGRGDDLRRARVLVVVAGMDGALPSVVGGLVDAPVIAVPTSTGYGASFAGVSALLAMLNTCSSGVTVVNIDNGFGAGYAAAVMMRALTRQAAT